MKHFRPLRTCTAAPSPAVLSFLRSQVRNAFELQSPTAARRCGALLRERGSRDVATCARARMGMTLEVNGGNGRVCSLESACTPVQRIAAPSTLKKLQCPTFLANRNNQARSSSIQPLTTSIDGRRCFSSTPAQRWTVRQLWSKWRRKRARQPPLKLPTSPLAAVTEDGTNGLPAYGRSPRSAANELKMRCTELDEHGNVTMVSGEFKKSELIAKYGLLPRDLRKIDSSLLPHILVRPSAILINLLHLRVLIKHNRVLVFDAYGTSNSTSQSVFMYDLDSRLRQKENPANGTLAYEFRALEAVLFSVTLGLEKEFEGVSGPVVRVLMELEEDIDRDKLRYLLVYSKKLGSFEQKARLVRDALTELLEADDDLSAMYLSEKAQGRARGEHDHTEVEMLLESYHKVADEIVQAAENLVSSIRNTEEIVKAILDANRNSLMLLDLRFTIVTLSLTAGTFGAALYGMNLKNFMEDSDVGFWFISGLCSVVGVIIATYSFRHLRRVQRLTMWGHGDKVGPLGGRRETDLGTLRLRAGENVGDLIVRERAVARRLAKAERRSDRLAES